MLLEKKWSIVASELQENHFLVSNEDGLGGVTHTGKGSSGIYRSSTGTGQLSGLHSVATLDFGSQALRRDTAAALWRCCAYASKGRSSPCSLSRLWPLGWDMPILRGESTYLKEKKIPLCLTFPSVKRTLAVLTQQKLVFMGCRHLEKVLLKGEVLLCSVLGVAGSCVFLLVLG